MAQRFLVNGGTGNWNSTTNWSATDGGASGASFPTVADDVFLTAASAGAPITINVTSAAKTITCTGYTGTYTTTSTLTVSGNITLASGMTIAGTGTLACIVTSTLTSAGKTWPGTFQFGGTSQTYTLADNWIVTGNTNANLSTTMCTLNGNTLYIGGSLSMNRSINGTTNIVMNGSGDVGGIFTLYVNLTINTAGSYTISSLIYRDGTLTYTSGTITGTPTLTLSASAILNTAGINWTVVSINATATITNNSLLTIETLNWTGAAVATNAFAGTAGFIVGTMTNNGAQRTYILKNGLTYIVTNAHTSTISTAAIHNVFTSDSGTIKAILTYQQGATFDLSFFDFTRIDASNGLTIEPYKGIITDCLNVRLLPVDIQQLSF